MSLAVPALSEAERRRALLAAVGGFALMASIFAATPWRNGGPAVSLVRVVSGVALPILVLVTVRGLSPGDAIGELGLRSSPVRGLLIALALTSPMLIGLALQRPPDFSEAKQAPIVFSYGWIGAAFVEETFCRGLFFGQLRRAGVSLVPAALIGGLLFGLLHVSGAIPHGLPTTLAVVALTAAGGVLFCWVFERWGWDLWLPIGIHAFMNLWWALFQGGDTAAGNGASSNVPRAFAIATIVVATITHSRRGHFKVGPRARAPPQVGQ